jgi:hypothetical protein
MSDVAFASRHPKALASGHSEAFASRYPEALALGLSTDISNRGFSPWGMLSFLGLDFLIEQRTPEPRIKGSIR